MQPKFYFDTAGLAQGAKRNVSACRPLKSYSAYAAYVTAETSISSEMTLNLFTVVLCVITFIASVSHGYTGWSNTEIQCAASHYACLKTDGLDPYLRQDMCYSCYKTCMNGACTRNWCPMNALGRDHLSGCLYNSPRGMSGMLTWNTAARSCAAAHLACKFSPGTDWLHQAYCSLCKSECNNPNCREHSCKSKSCFCSL